MHHWAFWLGGLALGGSALVFMGLTRRPFGVSGALGTVLRPHDTEGEAGGCDDDHGRSPPFSVGEAAAFLGSIVLGGALSALLADRWGTPWQAGLGPAFQALFGEGAPALALVLSGGTLVGFGTQWARGCTSGHGLVGVARRQPPSLLATAVFFGTAIAVSLVVDAVLA